MEPSCSERAVLNETKLFFRLYVSLYLLFIVTKCYRILVCKESMWTFPVLYLYLVSVCLFSCIALFVSISQVIGCEDRLRNDLLCVGWGVKLYSLTHVNCWLSVYTQHWNLISKSKKKVILVAVFF